MTDIQQYLARTDRDLARYMVAAEEPPQRLHEAMRYCMSLGGDRMHAVMCLAVATAFAGF